MVFDPTTEFEQRTGCKQKKMDSAKALMKDQIERLLSTYTAPAMAEHAYVCKTVTAGTCPTGVTPDDMFVPEDVATERSGRIRNAESRVANQVRVSDDLDGSVSAIRLVRAVDGQTAAGRAAMGVMALVHHTIDLGGASMAVFLPFVHCAVCSDAALAFFAM